MAQKPLKLIIKSLKAKLIPAIPDYLHITELWGYLDSFLSYEVHNSFFIKAMSNNPWVRDTWDGCSHLFNTKTGTFPTGLLPYVLESIKQFNIPVDIDDLRPAYARGTSLKLEDLEMRPYQTEAVEKILKYKRGIIWARPRAGKTLIAIRTVAELAIFPVLNICQSIDIARQTKDKFEKFLPGVKVGIIGDGECDIQDVTIATIQSLSAAYGVAEKIPKKKREQIPALQKKTAIQQLVETAKFVWVDECHHSVSNTHKLILQNKCYAAEFILGCSGTPFREDNTNLLMEGLLGPIIYEIDYSRLIHDGFLVRPTVHLIKIPQTLDIPKNTAFAALYKEAITENGLRNGIISNIACDLRKRGKSCMVLVNKIKHGKELEKLIPGSKFSQAKSKDRTSLWHQLRVKKLKVLITTLGDEGVDIPSLDATIIAAGGESAIKVFQRLRCMTPFKGKNHAIVVDFLDPYKYLRRHSKKREKLYRSEESFRIVYKTAEKK